MNPCACGCGQSAQRTYIKGHNRRGVPTHAPRTALERVLARISVEERGHTSPCWVFQGANWRGYGMVSETAPTGKQPPRKTHRVVYEALVGAIPDGLQLDHLCRVRECVNPAHLEPVTAAENMLRAAEARAVASGGLCRRGHDRALHTRISPSGRRQCRLCNADAVVRYQIKKKASHKEGTTL